jgi:hypothetical protein
MTWIFLVGSTPCLLYTILCVVFEARVINLCDRDIATKGHNFWSDRWISLKFLQEFPEAVFLGVYVESLLGDAEVSSLQTRVSVEKRHKFWSNHWISLKFLQVFVYAVFLGVYVESLLIESKVSALET